MIKSLKNDGKIYTKPFPFIELENCIDKTLYDQLKNEFPNDDFFNNSDTVMGGRRRIASDEPEFYSFLDQSAAWNSFYNYINSIEFIQHCFSNFEFYFKEQNIDFRVEQFKIDTEFHKSQARNRKNFITEKISKINKRLLNNNKSDKVRYNIYTHFDISSAHNGYVREIHRDSAQRILNFLIFFNEKEEAHGNGGDFLIHQHNITKPLFDYEVAPNEKDTSVYKTISPQDNLGVFFLSTPNSYHSVSLIENASKFRNFIYVGISSKSNFFWIKK